MGSQSQNSLHNNINNNNNSMIALLFCSLIVAAAASNSCQEPVDGTCKCPGNAMCHSSDPLVPDSALTACCDGSECLPWGDDDDARFCQFVEDIPVGGDCSGYKGSCVASSTCVDGVCA